MTGGAHGGPHEGDQRRAPFARPFLNRGSAQLGTAQIGNGRGAQDPMVRAYTITGGRTSSQTVALQFESMVSTTDRGHHSLPMLTFERKKIATLCDRALSVAEISATLHVPIGVAKVLVGDLIVDGVLELYDAPTDVTQDLSLVRELIDGIRNL